MAWKDAFSIVNKVTKWIDEWKSGATERRLRKIQKLKDALTDVEKDLLKYKNFKKPLDYRNYLGLLKSKRMYERKIMKVANK